MCAQCLLCPKRVQLTRSGKSRFTIWSWRRDLNPRPSDYKSDALPAELRQRKPPVTGHKVNKLAQRQSACNILNHRLVRGNVTCVVPLQLNILARTLPLRPPYNRKSHIIYTG